MAVAEDKFILTQEGYENIKRELAELEADQKEKLEMLSDSLNDRVGGDDADTDVGVEFEARTRKERTDERVGHLRYILERAEIYEDPDPERINTGERVTLWDFEDKREIQLDVLSSAEVTTRANVGPGVQDASDVSPIGKALLGKRVGDIVEVEIPDGKTRYAVRKIEPIPAG